MKSVTVVSRLLSWLHHIYMYNLRLFVYGIYDVSSLNEHGLKILINDVFYSDFNEIDDYYPIYTFEYAFMSGNICIDLTMPYMPDIDVGIWLRGIWLIMGMVCITYIETNGDIAYNIYCLSNSAMALRVYLCCL